jgi:hypothetical protein
MTYDDFQHATALQEERENARSFIFLLEKSVDP